MQTTFMNASVTRSATTGPEVEATARSTSPTVQVPWASTPRAAAAEKAASSAAPPTAGSSRAVSRSWPSWARGGGPAPNPGNEPGAAGAGGRVGGSDGPLGAGGKSLLVEDVGEGAPDVALAHDRDLHPGVVHRGGLGGLRAREPQHQRPLALGVGQRLGARGHRRQRPLRQLGGGAHATPISTPRKRAGAEPWETRATWPGSPLPQLTTEASRHSEAEQTASIEPQNSGVTPA